MQEMTFSTLALFTKRNPACYLMYVQSSQKAFLGYALAHASIGQM